MTIARSITGTLLLATLLSAMLGGCGKVMTITPDSTLDRLQQQAQLLEGEGRYQDAAQLYLDAARTAAEPERHALQLLAAGSLVRGDELEQASKLLDTLSSEALTERNRQHYTLLRAAIALARQLPETVLVLLAEVPESGPYIADYRRLRANARLQNSQFFRAAEERVLLDPLLTDPEAQQVNRRAIWDAVNSLTDQELQTLRTAPPPDILGGWLELVELTRLYLQQPEALAEVTPHWLGRYPGHPAGGIFLEQLLESMRAAGQPPAQIGVLLPLSGELSGAAHAIRDGIAAAYYDTPEGGLRPQLRFYDTGDTPDSVVAAYSDAVTGGAQFVIGPLRKESVQALAARVPLEVKVLGLNRTGDPSLYNPDLYQFGLAPEDEAREVARLAWHSGHTRAIALLPETDWGERVYSAFAEEWELLGGHIAAVQRYDSGKADHGPVLKALLSLDSSKARQQKLTRKLGRELVFEPRRRQDVDFVFLAAAPRQARLIRPQLDFYRASDLPVYATSRVYSGRSDRDKDADMNGIVFCDTPWTLEQRASWEHLQRGISEFWPNDAIRYARLYALGIDAYRVIPYLGEFNQGMFTAYHGVTGSLSLADDGHINRTLRCAVFRKGLPELLEPDTPDTQVSSSIH
ncbi:MAG: penicillin-binding protein activator [Gammaproteobacteria bacterium]